MILMPPGMGKFEFARLSSLRAQQLIQGCIPRVSPSLKPTTTAQREVAQGEIRDVSQDDADATAGGTGDR